MSQPQAQITRLDFGLFVAVYGERAPTDEEWSRYIEVMRPIRADDSLLIFSWGGGPTFKQRRELEEVVAHHAGKAAVVTGSRIARGIVKAISWTGKQIKAFDFDRRGEAIEFLGLDEDQRGEALTQARVMAEFIGLPDAELLTK